MNSDVYPGVDLIVSSDNGNLDNRGNKMITAADIESYFTAFETANPMNEVEIYYVTAAMRD